MVRKYVVTKGTTDTLLLQKLLPANVKSDVAFIEGKGKSSAESMSRSLLAVKQRPLALVLDANSSNEAAIEEYRHVVREFLGQASAGTEYEVFLAVPEIEGLFFYDRTVLHSLIGLDPGDISFAVGQYVPRKTLCELLNRESSNFEDLVSSLDDNAICVLQSHPLIQDLSEFLTKTASEAAA